MPRLTVVIAGAGLCGLVFALTLQKYAPDVQYEIHEAAAELTTAGAGIGIPPRTLFVLRELGLEEALLKIAGNGEKPTLRLLYRKADQKAGFTFNEADPEESMTFHRAELQKIFMEHIRFPERIHLGKRFASYSRSLGPAGKIEVRFQDGSTATCDVLVGCDGIKSGVRAAMYTQLADTAQAAGHEDEATFLRSCIPAIFSGTVAYRGLIKQGDTNRNGPQPLNRSHMIAYCGKNKHLIAYPINAGRTLNVAAVVTNPKLAGTIYEGPWTANVRHDEVSKEFVGWEPEVVDIVQSMKSWSKWAINVVQKLPTFVHGPVALVGDAAHAMTPHQGAGAGQGFEDCLLLGLLLAQPSVTRDVVPNVLRIYDRKRRPVAQRVAAVSLRSGQLHSLVLRDPLLATAAVEESATEEGLSNEQLEKIREEIERLKAWRRGTTVGEDCQAALQMLREELGGTEKSKARL